ncbi:hypothetical protein MY4824_007479 [Beauveria thailandica]
MIRNIAVVLGSLAMTASSRTVMAETASPTVRGDVLSESELAAFAGDLTMGRNTWLSPHRSTNTSEHANITFSSPKGIIAFEYAEHRFLGDQITLTDDRGHNFTAGTLPLVRLGNIVGLTYGTISALAGDFYGTSNPISSGTDDNDRRSRFMAALNTLLNNPLDQPSDALGLVNYLQKEVDAVNQAVANGLDPSTVYKGGEVVSSTKLQLMTISRKQTNFPSYGGLALINWDHFGDDARTAYTTGHAAAIELAANGNKSHDSLFNAYAMNAFADHYLQDLFSAGHLRTPRRLLHGQRQPLLTDRLAQYMHDEDCALGLQVKNKTGGDSWTAYGDRRLLDKVNHDNLLRCQAAVSISAREIYNAWERGTVLPAQNYSAFEYVPTKESALASDQALAPLFLLGPRGTYDDLQRRSNIDDRKSWEFTTSWWVLTTLVKLAKSTRWNYPMTM